MWFLRGDLRFDSSFQLFPKFFPLPSARWGFFQLGNSSNSKRPIESDFYSNFSVARGWFLLKFPNFRLVTFPHERNESGISPAFSPRWSLFVTRVCNGYEPSRTDFLVKRWRRRVCVAGTARRGAPLGPLERKSGVWGARRALQDKLGVVVGETRRREEDLATSKWLAVVRPWIMHSFLETCFLRGWL